MIWLHHLPPIGLFLVLNMFIGAAAAGLWWLPKTSITFPLVRAGRELSPGLQAICGTLFVLAITFLASSVWATADKAFEAVAIEVREVRLLRTLSQLLPEPRRSEVVNLVTDYAEQSAAEWPEMADAGGSREAERVLAVLYATTVSLAPSAHPGEGESLRRNGFAPHQYLGANPYRQSLQHWRDLLNEQMLSQEFMTALKAVGEARERRLDIARHNLSSDQWAAMLILALIMAIAVTFVHANSEGGRAIALGLVSVVVSTALFLLIAHDRPFIGWDALGPEAVIAAAKGL